MRWLACVLVLSLCAAIPVFVLAGEDVIQLGGLVPPPFPGPGGDPTNDANYKAPRADGAVVELLDEGVDPLLPVLINDGGGEAGTAVREDRDVFAGVEAVRVTPMQKYRSNIPGWNFKIVETPKNAGEFRYLRFAWKKFGGSGLMIQFHNPATGWGHRFHAGSNVYGWAPSVQLAAKPAKEWEVHTRDLFKEFGAINITGFALAPLDGTSALFDHMLLGRSIADLDKATDAALGRVKPAKAMENQERDTHWENLMGTDRVKAASAQRAFLAAAPNYVAFIDTQLGKLSVDKNERARIRKLVEELDAESFDVRDGATDELVKLGAPATEAVRALLNSAPNDEIRYRTRLILRKLNGENGPVSQSGRLARAVRVLERANTEKARELLARVADGEFGFDIAPDAKAALARLPKARE
ncbi:hypothetical protein J8F10_04830 [Gemmata sp. G18]|uniref:HEAT repeat domain-containing protein n=1 Tax=Gemmata palustris TaxID=2822762 RepID=A0ABS5BLP0_9BACT|nr:hypothetical protein [Gemmata palustris]MBP3954608.1 hypothetical protein [Gemmata palustris]